MTEKSIPAPEAPSAPKRIGKKLWDDRWIYIFLLPLLILYSMYTVWPLLASYWLSLVDWSGFEPSGEFVGLQNYRELVSDPLFWGAFRNTFLFLAITVPLKVGLSLILAVVLNNKLMGLSSFFRTAIFLPVVTTGAIIGVVMNLILDPNGGPVNLSLLGLGVIDTPIQFLGDSATSLYSAMGVWVWKWFGVTLIYWLAALQTIPKDVYDAAKIDGASPVQTFRHITMPMLTPFAIIIILLTITEAVDVFDLILTLTAGGPSFSSEVIDVFVYRTAFAETIPRLGYASAAAIFFGLSLIILGALQGVGLSYARRRMREQR